MMTVTSQGKFNVGGVLLDRPFKIQRLGHFGFNITHMAEAVPFYTDLLGFRISDTNNTARRATPEQAASLGDARGYFMRYGGDHHAFVIFPKHVREALGRDRRFGSAQIPRRTWRTPVQCVVVVPLGFHRRQTHKPVSCLPHAACLSGSD